ncbi:MAG: ribbon-helix-helix protein, CopG family [Actinobacteria bacterium]|nr:ribbon-helix-helix protein, CopG family [Actinomycetota bacterium]
MGRPSRTVTISIPPELADRIDRAAEAEGRTRSELLREGTALGIAIVRPAAFLARLEQG